MEVHYAAMKQGRKGNSWCWLLVEIISKITRVATKTKKRWKLLDLLLVMAPMIEIGCLEWVDTADACSLYQ